MKSPLKVALVIPCYNEEHRLHTDSFISTLAENPGLTFLFVNDGSTDNTQKVIESICHSSPDQALSLLLDKNKGKGEAVRTGMCYLLEKDSFNVIGFWDADLAVPLQEVHDFMHIYTVEPDVRVVIGSRVHLAGRLIERVNLRHYVGRIFATVMCFTFGFSIYDTQCGTKLFESEALALAVKEPFCTRWIFDVELLIRLYRNNLLKEKNWLYEIPVKEWRNVSETKRTISAYVVSLFDYFKLVRKYLF